MNVVIQCILYLDREELFDSQLIKMILCRLVQQNFSFMFCSEFFAVPGFAIFYIDSPRFCIVYDLLLQLGIGVHSLPAYRQGHAGALYAVKLPLP